MSQSLSWLFLPPPQKDPTPVEVDRRVESRQASDPKKMFDDKIWTAKRLRIESYNDFSAAVLGLINTIKADDKNE